MPPSTWSSPSSTSSPSYSSSCKSFKISFFSPSFYLPVFFLILFRVLFSFLPFRFFSCSLSRSFLVLKLTVYHISVGSIYVETSNWDDFFPYGVKGAISGAGTVFFSFIGTDLSSPPTQTRKLKKEK